MSLEDHMRFLRDMSTQLERVQQELDSIRVESASVTDELMLIKHATDDFVKHYEHGAAPVVLIDDLYAALKAIPCYMEP